MSANYSDPAPGSDASNARKTLEPEWGNGDLPIDPHQPLREYTSSGAWPNQGRPPFPYTSPYAYPPAQAYPPQGQVQPMPPAQQPGPWSQGPVQPMYPGQPGGWQPYPPPGYPPYMVPPGHMVYGQPGYVYPGYGYYPVPPVVRAPGRDGYLLAVAIIAFSCSFLAVLGGLACLAIAILVSVRTDLTIPASQYFSGIVLYLALGFAGTIGGSFCFYHSMRSLFFKKPSARIWLPSFWFFLLSYLVVLAIGLLLHTQGQDVSIPLLTGLLIYLAAICPALAILALGIRRVSSEKAENSPTSWRRFTVALVSGATMSIFLALVLELFFSFILFLSQSNVVNQYLNNPDAGNPSGPLVIPLLVLLSVIAPLVEETVKPLAVVLLIGRVRSKAEAFTLGLACGIGFNLVETTGYISSGYNGWLNVALLRSGAGLLHGFGAAMVALGWYILTHKEEGAWPRRIVLGAACGLYAVLQHAIWNGSWTLGLIPGPIGNFFQNWTMTLGPVSLSASDLVNVVEAIGILIFFCYMAGRLRSRPTAPSEQLPQTSASEKPLINNAYSIPRQ